MLRPFSLLQLCLNGFCARFTSTKSCEQNTLSPKQQLLNLRNKTGYPLISCKEALKATKYDMQQAELYLLNLAKEKGWDKMQDISGKALCQGLIGVSKNNNSAAIVEVNCRTDFLAKTREFQRIVKEAADIALTFASKEKISVSGDELINVDIPGKNKSLQSDIALVIGKMKEDILVRRACVLTCPPGGSVGMYIHPSVLITTTKPGFSMGSFAAVASLTCTQEGRSDTYIKSRGRDICQHIVGMQPLVVGQVSEPFVSKDVTKPASSVASLEDHNNEEENIEVKAKTLYPPPINGSNELLKQPYLLDSDISVENWLDMCDMKVHDFIRYQVAETLD